MWLILLALTAAGGEAADDALQTRFQRMDRDGNGFITANEAPRLSQTRCRCAEASGRTASAGWIEDHDLDGDARVNAEEFLRRASSQAAGPPLSQAALSLAPAPNRTNPHN